MFYFPHMLQHTKAWQSWMKDLPQLSGFTIERCYQPDDFELKSAQLHHFLNASEQGYGSVSFLRFVSVDDHIDCFFLMGTSIPVEGCFVTIPQLEVTAATVATRINSTLRSELNYPVPLTQPQFWSQ